MYIIFAHICQEVIKNDYAVNNVKLLSYIELKVAKNIFFYPLVTYCTGSQIDFIIYMFSCLAHKTRALQRLLSPNLSHTLSTALSRRYSESRSVKKSVCSSDVPNPEQLTPSIRIGLSSDKKLTMSTNAV